MTISLQRGSRKRKQPMVTRRIVTANNEQGQSYFRHDGPTPGVVDLGEFVDEEIWRDDPAINDPNCEADPAEADSA